MTERVLFAFAAALAAGALNSVAGGGSFLSFPALLFLGLPPIVANATNNTAMWLGTLSSVGGYREELAGMRRVWPVIVTALAGGVLGAELLLHTPEATFTRMIPWLLLFATVIFAVSDRLRVIAGHVHPTDGLIPLRALPGILAAAVYGGYFGAGVSILILAIFALCGWTQIHRMNAMKTVVTAAINGIAVVPFLLARKIAWEEALILTVGAMLGGYFGARTARRVEPKLVRMGVVAVGAVMTAYFFVKGG